jgi:maleamate amidohydrolase
MCDLYRAAFGDEPLPLLESARDWPSSCGLAGWRALPHLQRLLAAARSAGIPVIHLTHMQGVPTWNLGTPRSEGPQPSHPQRFELMPEVAPITGEAVLPKVAPSGFNGTPLFALLNQFDVDTVIVGGESTSGCVRATVVDARSNRFRVVIPEECVFDRHEAPHAINLFDMNEKYADVVPLDDVLAYVERVGVARRDKAGAGSV